MWLLKEHPVPIKTKSKTPLPAPFSLSYTQSHARQHLADPIW